MSIVDNPKNRTAIAVYNALPSNDPVPGSNDDPDLWATADAVATATGYKPGTVAELLRKLERTDKIVERYKPTSAAAVWRRLGPVIEVAAEEPASGNGGAPAETAAAPRSGTGVEPGTGTPRSGGSGSLSRVSGGKPRDGRNGGGRRSKAATPAKATGPKREPVGDCSRCGKPVVKVGRLRQHANARTEAAADHEATTSKAALKRPMTGACTVCHAPMTKNGKTWEHDRDTAATRGHKATSAAPKTTGHRRAAASATESTYVGADLGELKAALVAHTQSAGITVADGIRAAVERYVGKARKAK